MPTEIPDNVDQEGTFLLSGSFINTILDFLREQRISVEDNSPLQISEIGPQGMILGFDGDGTDFLPDAPETGTYVLGSIDGTVQWLSTSDCSNGSVDGGDSASG